MELLSVRQYAISRGLTLSAVYQALWANRLTAIKVGREWKIQVPTVSVDSTPDQTRND
jgi:hypothetical protein